MYKSRQISRVILNHREMHKIKIMIIQLFKSAICGILKVHSFFRYDLPRDLHFLFVPRRFQILQIKKALMSHFSFKIKGDKGAPCMHILAARCTDFSTCAPGVCILSNIQ